MENNNNNPHKRQYEDTSFEAQTKIIFNYLNNHTATATMVAKATGIPQKNICRYKRTLEKSGRLMVAFRTNCRVTGFRASYLTTNENFIKSLTKKRPPQWKKK